MGRRSKSKNINLMTPEEAKQDFKANLKEKDMSPLLEYYYSLMGYNSFDDDPVSDSIVDYYSKVKNDADPSITETMYCTTNEGVREVFETFNVNGKRVATVGSSGDQAFHAIYYGAKEIDLIDANILTRALVELKMAAIKVLDYKQFDDFVKNMDKMNNSFKYYKYYQKISHLLPKDIQVFWDTIMLDGGENENFVFSRMFFTTQSELYLNSILNEEEDYNKLKKLVLDGKYKLNYIVADIEDFPKELKGNYDLILLSNVVDYCNLSDYYKVVRELYNRNLNIGGSIQLTTSRSCRFEMETFIDEFCDDREGLTIGEKQYKPRKEIVEDSGVLFAPSIMMTKTREYTMETK